MLGREGCCGIFRRSAAATAAALMPLLVDSGPEMHGDECTREAMMVEGVL